MYDIFSYNLLALAGGATGSTYDWTDFGPFGIAIAVGWFLLMRSDKAVDKEKLDSERDLQRVQKQLEDERKAHEATRKLLYERLALEIELEDRSKEEDV